MRICNAMRVASFFAGIGGICLGFRQAGFQIVWANEIDHAACKTYRNNFGDDYIVEGDIRNINPNSLPNFDVLAAGFPCQPFSIAGKQQGFRDERGNLFFEISRIVDVKRPKIIFLENVKNLLEHDDGKTFLVIYNSLAQFGYCVKYKIMNALHYGNIPQNRERIFIVAFLDWEQCQRFEFPKEIPLTRTWFDIIDRGVKHDQSYYYDGTVYEPILQQAMNDRDCIYKFTDTNVRKGRKGICPTLTANMGTYPNRVPIIKDNFGIRKLTPRECLMLQGFPESFALPNAVPIKELYKQAGNTVCVPVVHRIAEAIREQCSLQ